MFSDKAIFPTPDRKTHVVFDVPDYSPLAQVVFFERRGKEVFQFSNVPDALVRFDGEGWSLRSRYDYSYLRGNDPVPAKDVPLETASRYIKVATRKRVDPNKTGSGISVPAQNDVRYMYVVKQTAGADWGHGLNPDRFWAEEVVSSLDALTSMFLEDAQKKRLYSARSTELYPRSALTYIEIESHDILGFGSGYDTYIVKFPGPYHRYYLTDKTPVHNDGVYYLAFAGNRMFLLVGCFDTDGNEMPEKYVVAQADVDSYFRGHRINSESVTVCIETRDHSTKPNGRTGFVGVHLGVIPSMTELYADLAKFVNNPVEIGIDAAIYGMTVRRPFALSFDPFLPYENPRYKAGRGCKLELSVPYDHTGAFQIYRGDYVEKAVVIDAPIGIVCPSYVPDVDTNVYWDAELPEGTSISCKVVLPTGAKIEPKTEPGSTGVNFAKFSLPFEQRTFALEWTLNASPDRMSTPTLYSYTVERNGVYTLVSHSGEWEAVGQTMPSKVNALKKISIESPDTEIWQAKASIQLHDLSDSLTRLQNRGTFTVKIETEYDPGDPSKRCVLFRGYVNKSERVRRGRGWSQTGKTVGPADHWCSYNLECTGMWQRLEESFFEQQAMVLVRSTPRSDGTVEVGNRITDIVKYMLNRCGFPDEMIGIEDLPVTFMPIDDKFPSYVNPLTKIGDFMKSLCRDYLNKYLWFDENLGDHGKWTLIAPASAPYQNKVHFTMSHPSQIAGDGKPRLYQASVSWGTDQNGVPYVPMRKDSFKSWIKPPEANEITVSSVRALLGTRENATYAVTVNNPRSYNFYPGVQTADPNHPDYLGRRVSMWFFDPLFTLSSSSDMATVADDAKVSASLYMYAKRLFDMVCLAVKRATFMGPLVLIPHEKEPGKYRPLRFYDPVLIGGEQWLIRSVNISYEKDFDQTAVYEVERPRF